MRQLSRGWLDMRWVGVRAACALVVLVLVPLAFAQSALGGEGDEIEGTVTSAATMAPIKGIEVCTGERRCVSTNANGTYAVPAPPVSVRVEFNAPSGSGFVSHTYYKNVFLPSKATELTVPVGETISGIDAELKREGSIEGVVISSSTQAPIARVEVCASPLAGSREEATCTHTNRDGVYQIPGLAPLQYEVRFKPGALNYLPETPQREYALYPTVRTGRTTANVDAALTEGAQIKGLVESAATGLVVSGVDVCANGFGPSFETKCAKTNDKGRYLLDGLETSSYHVSFFPERPYVAQHYDEGNTVWVNEGETLPGVNARLLTGATISGVVTSASTDEPVREVEVCINERVEEDVSRYCTEPNEAGEYQLTGIATSTDIVEFNDFGYEVQYWNHVGVFTEATQLHITVGEAITGIDAALIAR